MKNLIVNAYVTIFFAAFLGFFTRAQAAGGPPQITREFRGAWIATVGNIDWPSKPGLSSQEQRAELTALLDKAVQLKLNAVVFQVRPACDALYNSRLEPWSEYLTGQMGQAPQPYYDPLAFAIEQAHQRGLELHAWFNPFRAGHLPTKAPPSANHISRMHPEVVRTYGKFLWLDPGDNFVREYSTAVILDVVKRYDIDGVHLDDYFYPYKEKNAAGEWIDFPDGASWKRYVSGGGKLDRADWRRKNVDDFVQNLHQRIRAEKSWVKFGISPFGIWRPGYPQQVTGLDAYDSLFADSRKWLMSGWLDYCSPQLYWAIRQAGQSYPVLLQWWAGQNPFSRHLWPGNNSVNVGASWKADEIVNQIRLTRRQQGSTGNLHWNISSLVQNRGGLGSSLSKEVYSQPALIPASPWLDNVPPGKPKVSVQKGKGNVFKISWEPTGTERVWLWVLQAKNGKQWSTQILPGKDISLTLRQGADAVALTAVDRCGNVGITQVVQTKTAVTPRMAAKN